MSTSATTSSEEQGGEQDFPNGLGNGKDRHQPGAKLHSEVTSAALPPSKRSRLSSSPVIVVEEITREPREQQFEHIGYEDFEDADDEEDGNGDLSDESLTSTAYADMELETDDYYRYASYFMGEDSEALAVAGFTVQEARRMKMVLQTQGYDIFFKEFVEEPQRPIFDMLVGLGFRMPKIIPQLDQQRIGIAVAMQQRCPIDACSTVEQLVQHVKDARNIIVICGAGISTSVGIPDFRSDTGIYARMADYNLTDPQDRGVLRTVYTQNIDGLEIAAGVSSDHLVQCHGSFKSATCIKCRTSVPGDEIKENLLKGEIANCKACEAVFQAKSKRKGKRPRFDDSSDDNSEESELAISVMKPDIIFFGEKLPDTFAERIRGGDLQSSDLVLCIGTSLQVAPVSDVMRCVPRHIPQVFISKTTIQHMQFDLNLLGPCDDIISDICARCEWDLQHPDIPGGSTLSEEYQKHRLRWRQIGRETFECLDATVET